MPEARSLTSLWQEAWDTNLRYYQAWAKLANQWLSEVSSLGSTIPEVLRTPGAGAPPAGDRSPGPTATAPGAPAPGAPAPGAASAHGTAPANSTNAGSGGSPALVLEGLAGEDSVGVFMVRNHLPHPVDAPVVASPFTGPGGQAPRLAISLEPALLSLAPGEQILVRVKVPITADLDPGAEYRSQISVPGLTGTQVAVILRRTSGGPNTGAGPPGEAGKGTAPPL